VVFAIGAWGRKYRGRGKLVTRFFDAETGTEIDAITIDRATGAPIGTRPIRIAAPSEQAKPGEGIGVGVAVHELKIFADITKHYRCELTSRFHRFLL
jgi:hypothetical protein